MGRWEQIIDGLGPTIQSAVNNAGITVPMQIYQGNPIGTELGDIVNQGQAAVSIFPSAGGRRVAPRAYSATFSTFAPVYLAVSVNGASATFSGTATPGLLVYVYMGTNNGTLTAKYTTLSTDTAASVAAALNSLINSLNAGPTCTVAGATITVSGVFEFKSQILTTGSVTKEVSRMERRVQISVWAQNFNDRAAIADAITNNVGTEAAPFIDPGDGFLGAYIKLAQPPYYKDEAQLDYTLYQAHLAYSIEYSVLNSFAATQVGVVAGTLHLEDQQQNITFEAGEIA